MDFSKNLEGVQVGDDVWDVNFEWGKVITLIENKGLNYPLEVAFNKDIRSYTRTGLYDIDNKVPSLFFAPIEFEIPKRQKPKVKKYLVAYMNHDGDLCTTKRWESKEYFESEEDFKKHVFGLHIRPLEFVGLIQSSMIEVVDE